MYKSHINLSSSSFYCDNMSLLRSHPRTLLQQVCSLWSLVVQHLHLPLPAEVSTSALWSSWTDEDPQPLVDIPCPEKKKKETRVCVFNKSRLSWLREEKLWSKTSEATSPTVTIRILFIQKGRKSCQTRFANWILTFFLRIRSSASLKYRPMISWNWVRLWNKYLRCIFFFFPVWVDPALSRGCGHFAGRLSESNLPEIIADRGMCVWMRSRCVCVSPGENAESCCPAACGRWMWGNTSCGPTMCSYRVALKCFSCLPDWRPPLTLHRSASGRRSSSRLDDSLVNP